MNVLGIDYSYEEDGFAVIKDGMLVRVSKINFLSLEKQFHVKLCHAQRRKLLKQYVRESIDRYAIDIIVLERIRLFSRGCISRNGIMALSELVSTIVDATFPECSSILQMEDVIPVYSVDVRTWKSKILGSAKATKEASVEFVKNRYSLQTTHNEADAICIGLFSQYSDMMKYVERER